MTSLERWGEHMLEKASKPIQCKLQCNAIHIKYQWLSFMPRASFRVMPE